MAQKEEGRCCHRNINISSRLSSGSQPGRERLLMGTSDTGGAQGPRAWPRVCSCLGLSTPLPRRRCASLMPLILKKLGRSSQVWEETACTVSAVPLTGCQLRCAGTGSVISISPKQRNSQLRKRKFPGPRRPGGKTPASYYDFCSCYNFYSKRYTQHTHTMNI